MIILLFTITAGFASNELDEMQVNDNSTDKTDALSVYSEIEDENNLINEQTSGGDVLSSTSDNDVLKASEVYISPTGSSSGDGSQESPYDWNTAYSNVDDGGTIYLLSGTYNILNKDITKSIKLNGIGNVIFDANGNRGYFFKIDSVSNIVIDNIKFINGKETSGSSEQAAIM